MTTYDIIKSAISVWNDNNKSTDLDLSKVKLDDLDDKLVLTTAFYVDTTDAEREAVLDFIEQELKKYYIRYTDYMAYDTNDDIEINTDLVKLIIKVK